MDDALGLLETTGYTAAIAALDVLDKAANVQVLQAELNDFLGICLKITGHTAAVQIALQAAAPVAEQLGGDPVIDVIHRADPRAWTAINSPREHNPLIQQDVVHLPAPRTSATGKEKPVTVDEAFALGFIETQGFTAVFDAIDAACKAADVEVVCKEKLGGGYVTVVIRGDVAAVKAAVEAGQARVGQLGKLVAAHVIARPSPSVLSLLPGH